MIEVGAPKATKTLYGSRFSAVLGKTSIDNPLSDSVFRHLFRIVQAMQATLPGSSVAEQVTVNHLVVGSIPTRAATSSRNPAGGRPFDHYFRWNEGFVGNAMISRRITSGTAGSFCQYCSQSATWGSLRWNELMDQPAI